MPAIMEISVVPTGKDGASLGDTMVHMLQVAERHGISYELNAMGTVMEGDLDALLRVARDMHNACFEMGYPRVITLIKLDDRRDKDLSMKHKVESVEAKLAKERSQGSRR